MRIQFPGALYHLMARGNAGQDIFEDATDRRAFLNNLQQVCERLRWRLWAYCLMDNHYHLLAETLEANLAQGMRQVNGVYTQSFNRRHGRAGHVLQGRYKALLVDKDSYLLELMRYIVLNPVRAGMCEQADEWPWSSQQAMMGKAQPLSALAVDAALAMFDTDRDRARGQWTQFVAAGIGRPPPEERQQLYVGDDDFIARVTDQSQAPLSTEIPRQQRRRMGLAEYEALHPVRNTAIRAAHASGDFTLREIGEHFGLHYSTISRIVRAKAASLDD